MRYDIGESYEYCENPIDDPIQRESYFKLANKTFGLDFSIWYDSGWWGDRFIPHTLFDKGIAVASVGVVVHDFEWQGRIRRYIQISTVMTDPGYRGRGLNGHLMEKALDTYKVADSIYLYANDSVVDYYSKFGFERVPSYRYRYSQPIPRKKTVARKLDLGNPDDIDLLARLYTRSNPYSALTMVNNPYLLMFHCLTFLHDDVYYIDEYDAVVVAEHEDGDLLCYDIYTQTDCDVRDMLGALVGDQTKTVTFGFLPKSGIECLAESVQEENTTLMILNGKENPVMDNKVIFPLLSRA